jgi:hypothetical protein
MQRWIAKAAGGASQRLNRGEAMVRSRSRNPAVRPSPPAGAMLAICVFSLGRDVFKAFATSCIQPKRRLCDFMQPYGERPVANDDGLRFSRELTCAAIVFAVRRRNHDAV